MSQKSKTKIVITGTKGFLGRNLVDALKDNGKYIIYALSSQSDEVQSENENVQYCHKDAVFSDKGKVFLQDAIVVNCAFPRDSTGTGMADGLQYIQKLFDCSREYNARAVINISSQSVYSQKREEIASEETPLCLESPYAVGKYSTELMLESACRDKKIAYTNIRMASLIGPGFDQRIVNRFIKQAFEGQLLNVVKSEKRFGFLDVMDAVFALISLIEIPVMKWRPIYNLGNGISYSILEIADSVKHVFGENGLQFMGINEETRDDFGNTGISYYLLHKDTEFEPKVDLNCSIQRILDYMRGQ